MKKIYFLIMLLLGLYSCQKEVSYTLNTNVNPQVDVYVAGFVFDNNGTIPAYWKNGRLVLIDSSDYLPTVANSIAVSGNDVYVAGYFDGLQSGQHIGKYWKNGVGWM